MSTAFYALSDGGLLLPQKWILDSMTGARSGILPGLQLALKRQEPFLSPIGTPRSQIEKKVAMKNAAPRKK